MPTILFLIDTSLSMNRKAASGRSLLDLAKNSVETFIKTRQRDPLSRGDRYMLLTTDTPYNIKVDWKDSSAPLVVGGFFYNALRELTISGDTNMEQAITRAFDLLNLHRVMSGIDNYGKGRQPWYVEQFSLVILVTDGNISRVHHKLRDDPVAAGGRHTPSPIFDKPFTVAESRLKQWELTQEPYRWDQRMFCLSLKVASLPDRVEAAEALSDVPTDDSPLTKLCEDTGGRSYAVGSEEILRQCIESIVQKIECGIVCNFKMIVPHKSYLPENFTEVTKNLPQSTRRLLKLRTQTQANGIATNKPQRGHWPIPEDFMPEVANARQRLPIRSAHPSIGFVPMPLKPHILSNFAFDKYELESSPLTQAMLNLAKMETKDGQRPLIGLNSAWYTYVLGSNGNLSYTQSPAYVDHDSLGGPVADRGFTDMKTLPAPFGYLRPNTGLTAINLYVMPYNFPRLLQLVDEVNICIRDQTGISYQWKSKFEDYIQSCPIYYIPHLRQALRAIPGLPVPQMVPDGLGRTMMSLASKEQIDEMKTRAKRESDGQEWRRKVHNAESVRHSLPCTLKTMIPLKSIIPDDDFLVKNFPDFHLQTRAHPKEPQHPYVNPFHVERSDLLTQLVRMRRNLHAILTQSSLIESAEGAQHRRSLPIAEMGLYEQRMKEVVKPLRTVETNRTKLSRPFGGKRKQDTFSIDDNFDEGVQAVGVNRRKQGYSLPMKFEEWRQRRKENGNVTPPSPHRFKPRQPSQEDMDDDLDASDSEVALANEAKTLGSVGDGLKRPDLDKVRQSGAGSSPRSLSRPRLAASDMDSAYRALVKIERILRSPGRVISSKDEIKQILSEFNQATGIRMRIVQKTIALCERFKRYMLQRYLQELLKVYQNQALTSLHSNRSDAGFIPIGEDIWKKMSSESANIMVNPISSMLGSSADRPPKKPSEMPPSLSQPKPKRQKLEQEVPRKSGNVEFNLGRSNSVGGSPSSSNNSSPNSSPDHYKRQASMPVRESGDDPRAESAGEKPMSVKVEEILSNGVENEDESSSSASEIRNSRLPLSAHRTTSLPSQSSSTSAARTVTRTNGYHGWDSLRSQASRLRTAHAKPSNQKPDQVNYNHNTNSSTAPTNQTPTAFSAWAAHNRESSPAQGSS